MENFVFINKQVSKVEAKILEKWIVFDERRSVSGVTRSVSGVTRSVSGVTRSVSGVTQASEKF